MNATRRLLRIPSAGRVAGVCAGIAEYLDTDVSLVRLLWIVLSIVPGGIIGGLVAYLVAWAIIPVSDAVETQASGRRLTRPARHRKVAGVCGGLAEDLDVDPTAVRVAWAVLSIFPGTIVLGLIAYIVAWIIMPLEHVPNVAAAAPAQ